jgi:DNA-binding MarR family transcriptional regulator
VEKRAAGRPVPEALPVAVRVNRALRELLASANDVQHALAARLGIGGTDVQALQYLVGSERPLGTVDLAHALNIRSASATVLVDRLEAAGHVTRAPHPTDRRRVTLELTASARAEVRVALQPLIAAVSVVTGQLDPAGAEAVAVFLDGAVAAIRQFGLENAARPEEP